MQHEKSRLKIHTKAQPEAVSAKQESCPEIKEEVEAPSVIVADSAE
jgi:hypothetical protein